MRVGPPSTKELASLPNQPDVVNSGAPTGPLRSEGTEPTPTLDEVLRALSINPNSNHQPRLTVPQQKFINQHVQLAEKFSKEVFKRINTAIEEGKTTWDKVHNGNLDITVEGQKISLKVIPEEEGKFRLIQIKPNSKIPFRAIKLTPKGSDWEVSHITFDKKSEADHVMAIVLQDDEPKAYNLISDKDSVPFGHEDRYPDDIFEN